MGGDQIPRERPTRARSAVRQSGGPTPDPRESRGPGWRWVSALATAVLCSAALIWAQFSFTGLYDGDSYFHTRAAQQLREHGVRKEFPQTQFSTWKERYSDKDFLFHVLLIPFCGDGDSLTDGGKKAVALLDAALLLTLAVTMVRLGFRFTPLWLLLFLATNMTTLRRLMSVRPHHLGMILLLVEILLVLKGRWKLLVLVSALHVLSHSSFVFLPPLLLACLAAHLLKRRPLPWKLCVAGLLGLGLGSLLHPYFPNNLTFAYDQLFQVARHAWGEGSGIPMDLFGRELYGIGMRKFAEMQAGWLPSLAGLLAFLVWRGSRSLTVRLWTLLLMTGGLLVLTFLSARFFFPFLLTNALLAGALWTELAGNRSWGDLTVRGSLYSRAAALLLAASLAGGELQANPVLLRDLLRRLPNYDSCRPAIRYLDSVAAPGDIVYHNFWWDFAPLYHFRPNGRYIEALDPVFLYRYDPGLFNRMLLGYRGRSPDLYGTIARSFGARWVYVPVQRRNLPFRTQLVRDQRIRRVYRDTCAEIYAVD